MTKSAGLVRCRSTPSLPSAAKMTSWPADLRICSSIALVSGSSSMTRIRAIGLASQYARPLRTCKPKAPGSDRHGHRVSKTSKGLDHEDQLWHTCHARWRSSLQRGSPPPPPMTNPAGPSSLITPDLLSLHRARALDTHCDAMALASHTETRLGATGERGRASGCPLFHGNRQAT